MRGLSLVVAMALCSAAVPARGDDDEARKTADGFLKAGAALFDRKDAVAIAGTYLEEAELMVISRKDSEDGYKTESRRGRADIERLYSDMFNNSKEKKTTSRNVVEDAKFLAPDLIVVRGRFAPDVDSGDSYAFVQVRARREGAWRIQTLQLFIVPPG